MTLAIRQNCSRRVQIIKDFLILFAHVLHLWSTQLWKGLRISFEAMKRAATLWEWKNGSLGQHPNLKTVLESTYRQSVWAAQVAWERLFSWTYMIHLPKSHTSATRHLCSAPPNTGIISFTSDSPSVLYTTSAEWSTVHSPRDSCDQVTAHSAHVKLTSRGTLLGEGMSSNKNLPLQKHHTLRNAPLSPCYEWNQAEKSSCQI